MKQHNVTGHQLAKLLFAFLDIAQAEDLKTFNDELYIAAKNSCPQGTIAKVANLYKTIHSLNTAAIQACGREIDARKSSVEKLKLKQFSKELASEAIDEQLDEIRLYRSLMRLHSHSQHDARVKFTDIASQVPID